MTSFFPTLYPDELLYSAIARYHQRSGNISWKHTADDLFGTQSVTLSVDLPARIKTLVEAIPYSGSALEAELIWEHTLFPYYTAFQSGERRKQIKESMLSCNGGDIHTRAGIMACTIKTKTNLFYCASCVEEDFAEYGETYWRRSHQLPGVFMCPKHWGYLSTGCIPIKAVNKYQALLADDCNKKNEDLNTVQNLIGSMNFEKRQYDLVTSFCYLSKQLLEEKWIWKKIATPHKIYQNKLYEFGYANVRGHIRQKRFQEEFVKFFGERFLELLQCSLDVEASANWLSDIVRHPKKSNHPVRHILVMLFLGIDFKELTCLEPEIKPFGDGPWPCLNTASEHYKEPIIKNVKVTIDAKAKKIVGTFLCECGFEYCRSGPDTNKTDFHRIGRVKTYGKVWEKKLTYLIDQKLSLREMARKLNSDPKTVDKYARKLKLKCHWEKREQLPKEHNISVKDSEDDFESTRQEYRSKWIKITESNPNKTKTEMKKIYGSVYRWLYRWDKSWINAFSEHKVGKNNNSNRVDWVRRDEQIREDVVKVVKNLRESTNKPMRITISRVGRELGKLNLLQRHLDKMPLTKSYLLKTIDSLEEYQKKRFLWAVNELEADGKSISISAAMRKAGLKATKDYMTDHV